MTIELPLALSFPPGAQGPRDALAQASIECESTSFEEEDLVAQGRDDVGQLLTYSHEHVKRLMVPDWRMAARAQSASTPLMRLEWTRTGDMSHLGDPSGERRIHDALESFACSGFGHLYAMREQGEYRLHLGDTRIRFMVQGRRVIVLAVVRRERPSRVSLRRGTP